MYLETQYQAVEIDFDEILNQSFEEMQNFEYFDTSEESDTDYDSEETEEFDSDEDCHYWRQFDQAATQLDINNNCTDIHMYRLQKESEADEEILKGFMQKVLNLFNFDTLLWIKEALDSRKIANIFEIWTTDENVPATIEKDRQFYLNSIQNIKYGILNTFVFKYQSKIDVLNNTEDLEFILSQYLEFQEKRDEPLANLYKLVKNLPAEFIKSREIDVEGN